MSARIETLKPQVRIGYPFWVAVLAALLVVAAVAVLETSTGTAPLREDVRRSGRSAHRPAELTSEVVPAVDVPEAFTPTGRRGATPRVAAVAYEGTPATSTGRRGVTPRVPAATNELPDGPIFVNGELCGQCR